MPEPEQRWWLARFKRNARRHHCGHAVDVCSDPSHTWFPQRTICYPTMEAAAANAKYDELYGGQYHNGDFSHWSSKRDAAHPYGHRDGVTIWVADTDHSPDDTFLSRRQSMGEGGNGG